LKRLPLFRRRGRAVLRDGKPCLRFPLHQVFFRLVNHQTSFPLPPVGYSEFSCGEACVCCFRLIRRLSLSGRPLSPLAPPCPRHVGNNYRLTFLFFNNRSPFFLRVVITHDLKRSLDLPGFFSPCCSGHGFCLFTIAFLISAPPIR